MVHSPFLRCKTLQGAEHTPQTVRPYGTGLLGARGCEWDGGMMRAGLRFVEIRVHARHEVPLLACDKSTRPPSNRVVQVLCDVTCASVLSKMSCVSVGQRRRWVGLAGVWCHVSHRITGGGAARGERRGDRLCMRRPDASASAIGVFSVRLASHGARKARCHGQMMHCLCSDHRADRQTDSVRRQPRPAASGSMAADLLVAMPALPFRGACLRCPPWGPGGRNESIRLDET